MRNLLTAFAILFFGLLLAMTIATSKPKPEKTAEQAPGPISVSTIDAKAISSGVKVSSHGKIEAAIAIDLTAEVSGQVVWVSPKFIQGGEFKQGEVLLKIDATQYEAEVAQARARVAQAEELVKTEKARANQARKEWRDLGSDEANDLFLRAPQLANAKAQLDAAKAGLKRANSTLNKTQVSLPFPNHVTATKVNLGQFLLPGNKLASVYGKNDLQVNLPITQKQLKVLNLGWPLNAKALPDVTLIGKVGGSSVTFDGHIVSNSANFDDNNQLIHFLVKVKNPQAQALPGQYVEAHITGKPQSHVFLVPENAFHDKRFLLTIDENSTVVFVAAEFLSRDQQNIYVRSIINDGTKIITDRMPLATAGMQVSVKE